MTIQLPAYTLIASYPVSIHFFHSDMMIPAVPAINALSKVFFAALYGARMELKLDNHSHQTRLKFDLLFCPCHD
jgi:hypothetical protein